MVSAQAQHPSLPVEARITNILPLGTRKVRSANPRTIVVLLADFPGAINWSTRRA